MKAGQMGPGVTPQIQILNGSTAIFHFVVSRPTPPDACTVITQGNFYLKNVEIYDAKLRKWKYFDLKKVY